MNLDRIRQADAPGSTGDIGEITPLVRDVAALLGAWERDEIAETATPFAALVVAYVQGWRPQRTAATALVALEGSGIEAAHQ